MKHQPSVEMSPVVTSSSDVPTETTLEAAPMAVWSNFCWPWSIRSLKFPLVTVPRMVMAISSAISWLL